MNHYPDVYRAVGEPTRLRLLRLLLEAGTPLYLAELVDIIRRPQYAVSRAMRVLVRTGLVREERRGALCRFELTDDPFARSVHHSVMTIPGEDALEWYDRDRLRWRLELRREGRCEVTYTAGYVPREYVSVGTHVAASGLHRDPIRVLFVCVHNSARSQIAAAYLRHFGGYAGGNTPGGAAPGDGRPPRFIVESAGLTPGELNPRVVTVMAEEGFDISGAVPRSVHEVYRRGATYDYVITVCSPEAEAGCPKFPAPIHTLNWPFPDPATFTGDGDVRLSRTRRLRDEIREAVWEFVTAVAEEEPGLNSISESLIQITKENHRE